MMLVKQPCCDVISIHTLLLSLGLHVISPMVR